MIEAYALAVWFTASGFREVMDPVAIKRDTWEQCTDFVRNYDFNPGPLIKDGQSWPLDTVVLWCVERDSFGKVIRTETRMVVK